MKYRKTRTEIKKDSSRRRKTNRNKEERNIHGKIVICVTGVAIENSTQLCDNHFDWSFNLCRLQIIVDVDINMTIRIKSDF